jgi:hypothetical protein
MQCTAALRRIEEKRFNAGPKSNQHAAFGKWMRSSAEVRSRGVEAARRPQLLLVLSVKEFPESPRLSRSSPVLAASRSSFLRSRKVCNLNQCSPSYGVSWHEHGLQILFVSGPSKFESVRTKKSMNTFTNHLGRVYHV